MSATTSTFTPSRKATLRATFTMTCLGLLVGCDATTAPADLNRSRILAVRVSPPHLAPEQVAPIDILVGTVEGQVREVTPGSVTIEGAAPGAATDGIIARSDDGWSVACPPEPALAEIRGAFELEPDEPIAMQLAIDVEIDGDLFGATKFVFLGSAGQGPELAGITVSGAEIGEDGVLVVQTSDEIEIAADGAAGETELSYAWFSSLGTIDLYESEVATLTTAEPTTGQLVLVVRDQRGGVTWSWVDLRVQ